jgi:pimeloyl-ACP methyl ester carboxylesterase
MSASTLAHTRITAGSSAPERWMILLHGVFGTGGNLRTVARRVAERLPRWGFVLPDLRAHGQSLDLPGPHTLDAAAADVAALAGALGHPVHALGGHSFGGKVALLALAHLPHVERFALLDSMPGARPERLLQDQAGKVLAMLESMPWPLPSRERFFELVAAEGLSRPIAEWLAMQVRRAPPGSASPGSEPRDAVELRLELPAIRAMLEDYFARDLWPVLEATTVPTLVVVGGRSTVVGPDDRERLAALATRNDAVKVRVLPGAGHWLHVDDLAGLVEGLAAHLAADPV